MRKKNLTMIAVAAVIVALVYYFMQESGCMQGARGSKMATSIDIEQVEALESAEQGEFIDEIVDFAEEEQQ